MDMQLIGRSRKQKIVIGQDWLLEEFELDGRPLRYQQIEGSFTQPNGGVNRQMLGWACARWPAWAATCWSCIAATATSPSPWPPVRAGAGHRGQQVLGAGGRLQPGSQRRQQRDHGAHVQRRDQ
jgi:hypothetical protein